jgi:choline dehydrogenase-like flavoprotein
VVGSGPGGGPLAARLAIAGYKVLLIDAGSDQGSTQYEEIPGFWALSSQYAPMQWNYFINHYQNTTRAELDSKVTYQTPSGEYYVGTSPPNGSEPLGILYPRAGTLGGCAAHNALVSIYPHDSDWENIADLTGDQSWAPSKMRKYFEKLERNEYLSGHAVGHGKEGWLGISELDPSLIVSCVFLSSEYWLASI